MKVSFFLLAVLFATASSVPFKVEKSSDSQRFMVSRQSKYKIATKQRMVSPAHYWDTPHQYLDKEGKEMSYDRSSQNCSSDQKRSTNLSSLSAANLQDYNLLFRSHKELARLNRKHGMFRSSKQSGHRHGQHGSKKANPRLLQDFKVKSAQIDKISLRSKTHDCTQQMMKYFTNLIKLNFKQFGVSQNPQAKFLQKVFNLFSAAFRKEHRLENVIKLFKFVVNDLKILFPRNPAVHEQNFDSLSYKLLNQILTVVKNSVNGEEEKTLFDEAINVINMIGKEEFNDELNAFVHNIFQYSLHFMNDEDDSDEFEQVMRNFVEEFIPAVIRGDVTKNEGLRYLYNNIMVSIIHLISGTNNSKLSVLKDTDDAGVIEKRIIFTFAKLILPCMSRLLNEKFPSLSCLTSILVESFQEYENGYNDDIRRSSLQVN